MTAERIDLVVAGIQHLAIMNIDRINQNMPMVVLAVMILFMGTVNRLIILFIKRSSFLYILTGCICILHQIVKCHNHLHERINEQVTNY